MCKLRKELPPVNLAAVTCDSWSGMTGKLVPRSIIVCSMGSSTARCVKITGVCRSPPLPDGLGRRRLAALSGLPDSAARRQNFFGLYCTYIHICWFNFDALAQGNTYKPTKEPINYRGPGGDRTHDLQTEATPPAASCPARTLHATEIVPKNATPMTCPWLHWTTDNPSGMHRCQFQHLCVLILNCALALALYIFIGLILMQLPVPMIIRHSAHSTPLPDWLSHLALAIFMFAVVK